MPIRVLVIQSQLKNAEGLARSFAKTVIATNPIPDLQREILARELGARFYLGEPLLPLSLSQRGRGSRKIWQITSYWDSL